MMAAEAQDDDDIFVYMGGDQEVPRHVRRAKIHEDVKIVRKRVFMNLLNPWQLISVEFHDGVEMIEERAFLYCRSLRSIKLLGVKIIKQSAFQFCYSLTDVEFGDKLETIESMAFGSCSSLKKIKMPTVRTIGRGAFTNCRELSDVECGEGLRTLQSRAFINCPKLKRIALPLISNLIEDNVFIDCPNLTTVDLVGEIQQTVASLYLESWRNEMNNEMNRINQTLPTIRDEKTSAIQQWMRSSFSQLNHYKAEHLKLLKEATTLLELALWKVNLDENEGCRVDKEGTTRGGRKRARKEICVTSGAHVVIKNVLPFLQLLE